MATCHIRLTLAAATVFTVLTALIAFPGGIVTAYHDDMVQNGHYENESPEDHARNAELSLQAAQLQDRIYYKEALILELLAGRSNLIEVAHEFSELNRELDTSMNVMRSRFPQCSEEELIACNVILFAEAHDMSGFNREMVLSSLYYQYREIFGKDFPESK